MAAPGAVVVIEAVEVLARGLRDLAVSVFPGSEVSVAADPDGYLPGQRELVVCGPSALLAFAGHASDAPERRPAIAVIADPSRVDFAALLAVGLDVLWDYRGSAASFATAGQAALTGQAWVSDTLTSAMATGIGEQLRRGLRASDYGLTQRENEILQLLATGLGNGDIAAQLFISRNTVKNHVRAVLDKLHAGSRTEAVMIGVRVGLIEVRAARP